MGCQPADADAGILWVLLGSALILAYLSGIIFRLLVTPLILRLTSHTETLFDDYLLSPRTLRVMRLAVPGFAFYALLPLCVQTDIATEIPFIEAMARLYIVVMCIRLITSLLGNVTDYTSEHRVGGAAHLVGIMQFLRVVVWFLGGIVILSIFLRQNPFGIIAGLGAAATILMLVFQDVVLGLVGGIQLSANKMLQTGDWISIERLGIDGTVEQVSLTTVKVKNFDNSISTIQPYKLIQESFRNWQPMVTGGARRAKRVVNVDMDTVRLVGADEMERLKQQGLVSDCPIANASHSDMSMTNLTLFRHYATTWLGTHPQVWHGENGNWLLVRQLSPTPQGLPVEFWFYVRNTEFLAYEEISSQCMEHLIAVLPQFGLRVFQTALRTE